MQQQHHVQTLGGEIIILIVVPSGLKTPGMSQVRPDDLVILLAGMMPVHLQIGPGLDQ